MFDKVTLMIKALTTKVQLASRRAKALTFGFENINKPENTLVITGIPRSGTSLICSILNDTPDVVAFNEIFYDVYSLPKKLNEVRNKLVSGDPVPNKYGRDGKPTSDTMDPTQIAYVAQKPTSEDVIIATNANVPYLLKMRAIKSFGCPVIAMVRDPVHAIASYCSSRASTIPAAQVGPSPLPIHPRWKHIKFKGKTSIERRAEVWNYIAGLILEHQIPVIQYEKLIEDPSATLRKILSMTAYPCSSIPEPASLTSRNKESGDLEEIRDAIERFAPNRKLIGYT